MDEITLTVTERAETTKKIKLPYFYRILDNKYGVIADGYHTMVSYFHDALGYKSAYIFLNRVSDGASTDDILIRDMIKDGIECSPDEFYIALSNAFLMINEHAVDNTKASV